MQSINTTPATTPTVAAKRQLDLVDNEAVYAATTGHRAPEACWAPQRPMYTAPNTYTATTGFMAPSLCYAPQRLQHDDSSDDDAPSAYFTAATGIQTHFSDISSDEDETRQETQLYSATTGFQPPNKCWAPKRPRRD